MEIRPATTAVMAAVQAGSTRRLGALRASEADLDPDMARGLAFAFLVKALAPRQVPAVSIAMFCHDWATPATSCAVSLGRR
ncbi:hypothetical protein [Humitalea rosea]|uniref:hypothetical protein n=1 Tax=Humitalea rosea TaxID=990373 RepID=UPI001FE47DB9|nr:hypothetical protein [Humitalea rosea]